MKSFWLCFVPLFVAVNAMGVLPVFINLTEGVEKKQVRKIILQSMVTALVVAIAFIAVGMWNLQVFKYHGRRLYDRGGYASFYHFHPGYSCRREKNIHG